MTETKIFKIISQNILVWDHFYFSLLEEIKTTQKDFYLKFGFILGKAIARLEAIKDLNLCEINNYSLTITLNNSQPKA